MMKDVRVIKIPDLIKNTFIAARGRLEVTQTEYVRTQKQFCNICNIPNMLRIELYGYKYMSSLVERIFYHFMILILNAKWESSTCL